MNTVKSLLETKGHDLWSVGPDTSVLDALRLMADKNIGALLVTDGEQLSGVFSERDYARKVVLRGKTSRELAVRDVMTEEVIYVIPEQTIEECMQLMTERRIRHLPVMENGRLQGIISIGDVVKAVIADQQHTITHLEEYITGRR